MDPKELLQIMNMVDVGTYDNFNEILRKLDILWRGVLTIQFLLFYFFARSAAFRKYERIIAGIMATGVLLAQIASRF